MAFKQCPNCGDDREGSTIYKCSGCAKLFCIECKGYGQSGGLFRCPECEDGLALSHSEIEINYDD